MVAAYCSGETVGAASDARQGIGRKTGETETTTLKSRELTPMIKPNCVWLVLLSITCIFRIDAAEVGMSYTNSVGRRTPVGKAMALAFNTTVTNALVRLRSDLTTLSKEHRILAGIEHAEIEQGSVYPPKWVINQSIYFARGQTPLPDPYKTPPTEPGVIVVHILVTDWFSLAKQNRRIGGI